MASSGAFPFPPFSFEGEVNHHDGVLLDNADEQDDTDQSDHAEFGPAQEQRKNCANSRRYKLPAVYYERSFVAAGGLISYGPDRIDQFRRAAGYVDRILKGEKPADLPVQAPTKYELMINLKVAKATRPRHAGDRARPRRRGDRMRRREFIGVLGGAAVAWPVAARAQQSRLPVIGVLSGGSHDFPAFIKGVAESGYENGRNVRIEIHGGRYDQLRTMAQELVSRRVAVIAPMGIEAAQAAKEATSSIPIVFVFGVDPVKFGFVRSLNRPGGNITGMSLYTSELQAKRVELLDELVPAAAPIGMIVNPKMPDTEPQVQNAEAAARAKGHSLVVVKASSEDELDKAFAAISEHHVAAVLAVSDNFLYSRRDQIVTLAARYSIPMMYPFRDRCRRRRSPELRNRRRGGVSSGRHLRRPHPQGGQARGPSNSAADQVQSRPQSQDR